MTGEYSVVQFFADDTSEYVRKMVDAEEAVTAAEHYCASVAARLGMVKRVIITDALDCCCFEWLHGKGVVFPKRESNVNSGTGVA